MSPQSNLIVEIKTRLSQKTQNLVIWQLKVNSRRH
ncbi:MAG: hypothetical protein ACJAUY_000899 [Cognaticolwellia sp.]|jgi:hypothetical protein